MKKLIALVLAVLLIPLALAGCAGQGAAGADGKSAYELAVENGFVGSEADWIASLVGADGQDGQDGAAGITPQVRINAETNLWELSYDNGATWVSLGIPATGADGNDGDKGDKGDKGDTGETEAAKSGCGSVMGFGAAAILCAMAAAVALSRKE